MNLAVGQEDSLARRMFLVTRPLALSNSSWLAAFTAPAEWMINSAPWMASAMDAWFRKSTLMGVQSPDRPETEDDALSRALTSQSSCSSFEAMWDPTNPEEPVSTDIPIENRIPLT